MHFRSAMKAGSKAPILVVDIDRERHIRAVLDAVGGNKTRAAQLLGIDRAELSRWLDTVTDGSTDAS